MHGPTHAIIVPHKPYAPATKPTMVIDHAKLHSSQRARAFLFLMACREHPGLAPVVPAEVETFHGDC